MVLSPGSPCREAQRSVQAWWWRQGRRWLNPDTSALCQARKRLPIGWLRRLWWRMADRLSAQSPSLPGCHGRRVLVVDGATLKAPDTEENQACWPQPGSQKPGCGFPLVHLVGVFCLREKGVRRFVLEKGVRRFVLRTREKGVSEKGPRKGSGDSCCGTRVEKGVRGEWHVVKKQAPYGIEYKMITRRTRLGEPSAHGDRPSPIPDEYRDSIFHGVRIPAVKMSHYQSFTA